MDAAPSIFDLVPGSIASPVFAHRPTDKWADAILKMCTDAIISIDASGTILLSNPAAETLFGYPAGALLGRNVRELIPEPHHSLHDEYLAQRPPQVTCQGREVTGQRRDGSPLLVEMSISQVDLDDRQLFVAVIRDVSNLRRAQAEKLRNSEERFATAFRCSPDGLSIVRIKDYRIFEINPSWERITGYTAAEVIGRGAHEFDLVDPETQARGIEWVRKHGEVSEVEFQIRHKSGELRPILISAKAMNIDGEPCVLAVYRDISEQKQNERKLRENQDRLQMALSAVNMGIWEWCVETGKVHWSQGATVVPGISPDEFGNSFQAAMDLFHPEDRERVLRQLDDLIAQPERDVCMRFEFRMILPSGEVRWLGVYGRLYRSADGSPQRMIGTAHDIHDRKTAEIALIESEQRFRSLVEDSPVGIWQVGPDAQMIEYLNPSLRRLLGIPLEEDLRGQSIRDYLSPECLALAKQHGDLRQFGMSSHYEVTYLTRDDRRLQALVYGAPVLDHERQLTSVVGMGIDVTEQKRAEKELQRQASLIDLSFDAIFVWRENGGIELWNKGAEALYGFTAEEAAGKDPTVLLRTRSLVPDEQIVAELQRTGFFEGELRQYTKDGVERISSSRMQRMPNEVDNMLVLETNRDITSRRHAEDLAARHLGEMARMDRLIAAGGLASGLAHELNQPLTAIALQAGLAASLAEATGSDERQALAAAMREIVHESKRAGSIIRVLRGFVQKQSSRRQPERIAEIIGDVVKIVTPAAREARIAVRLRIGELPLLTVDRTQIGQLLLNLFQNAIDAMATPEITHRILDIGAELRDGGMAVIEVRNTGIGVAESELPNIFDSFFTTKPNGIGMGLAICRSIAEAHGGDLVASPNRGGGMLFTFLLPIE